MVVGVVVFDVNKAPDLVRTPRDHDASDRSSDRERNLDKSPYFFADFYTPRALERSSELTCETIRLVSEAFVRHRSYRVAPIKSLGGAAFTNPGGGMGFNPLARFMKMPVAPAPRTDTRKGEEDGSSQDGNGETPNLQTRRQSSHRNSEQDAALNVKPEKGVVRVNPTVFSSSSFGGLLEPDMKGSNSPEEEILLLWRVHGGSVAYCFIVKESDNLALAETCLGTLRMCLRAVLRDNNSVARHNPAQASGGGAQSAGTVDYDFGTPLAAGEVFANPTLLMTLLHYISPSGNLIFLGVDAARTICADIKQRIATTTSSAVARNSS